MKRPADDEAGDTVRVSRSELDDMLDEHSTPARALPAVEGRPKSGKADKGKGKGTPPDVKAARGGKGYVHVPATEDLTPLPPPRVLASMITEEGGMTPPPPRSPSDLTGPLPLPPAPDKPLRSVTRPLERITLGPRRLQLDAPLTARQLLDPSDARWTLGLWAVGGALGGMVLVLLAVALIDALRAGRVATLPAIAVAGICLIYPVLLAMRAAATARVRSGGIAVGPAQLAEEYQVYLEVAERLGMKAPPPLYIWDVPARERWLVGLARRRATVVAPQAFASVEALRAAAARELGATLVSHDEPLDVALLLPVRALFLVLTGWLRPLGLGLSPLQRLRAMRVHTLDRAACVGVGQLGPVLDELVAGGQRQLAARIDVAAVEAQKRGGLDRFLAGATSPEPSPAERVARLQQFAAPYLVRE